MGKPATPGPWAYRGKNGALLGSGDWSVRHARAGSTHWLAVRAGSRVVALVPGKGDMAHSNTEAVAAMIAAGPAMLEALVSLVAIATRYLPEYNENPEIQKASEAIVMAMGERA